MSDSEDETFESLVSSKKRKRGSSEAASLKSGRSGGAASFMSGRSGVSDASGKLYIRLMKSLFFYVFCWRKS